MSSAPSLPNGVVNISLFGSKARGSNDNLSDTDILVIVKDGFGTVPTDEVASYINFHIPDEISISWYSLSRIRAMFQSGDLFAWHIFYESKPLPGNVRIEEILGRPRAYLDALDDIAALRSVLSSVENAVIANPQNSVFEFGIVYVCARNIAMSATSKFLPKPDFGRYSPYSISTPVFPVERHVYEAALGCRLASQRGATPPDIIDPDLVVRTQTRILSWTTEVVLEIQRFGLFFQPESPVPDSS